MHCLRNTNWSIKFDLWDPYQLFNQLQLKFHYLNSEIQIRKAVAITLLHFVLTNFLISCKFLYLKAFCMLAFSWTMPNKTLRTAIPDTAKNKMCNSRSSLVKTHLPMQEQSGSDNAKVKSDNYQNGFCHQYCWSSCNCSCRWNCRSCQVIVMMPHGLHTHDFQLHLLALTYLPNHIHTFFSEHAQNTYCLPRKRSESRNSSEM